MSTHICKRTSARAAACAVTLSATALSLMAFSSVADQGKPANAPAIHKTSFVRPAPASSKPSLESVVRSVPDGIDNELVFSAPPRESEEEGIRTYQPVAEYLSRIIGRKIVYRHPSNWFSYQAEMQRGSYDLVFDGPHFNSWRLSNLQHQTLVKVTGENSYAVVVRKEDNRFTDIKQLAGQKVCGMDPPNLGTLAVLGQFDNPMRQPLIVNSLGWTKVYEGVALEKKCAAGILPVANLQKFSSGQNLVRVLYQTRALPNQAFSAGPRISRQEQAAIAAALISQEGASVTARLRAAYGGDRRLAYATRDEYSGYDVYLKNTWGYSH